MLELEKQFADIGNYAVVAFESAKSSYIVQNENNENVIALESVKDAVISQLYTLTSKKIAKLDNSYQSLLETNGDITKHPKYKILSESITTAVKLAADANIKDEWLNLLSESFNALVTDSKTFGSAFKSHNELGRQYYFSVAVAVITLTSFIVNMMIVVRENPNQPADLIYELNDKVYRGAPKFSREILTQYVKFSKSGKLKKDVDAANKAVSTEDYGVSEESIAISNESLAGVAIGVATGLIVFATAGPLIRHTVYTVATIKKNMYDYFDNMEYLLAINVEKLESGGVATSKTIAKQKKYIALMSKFKAMFIREKTVAESSGSKELKDEEDGAVSDAEGGDDQDDDVVF